MNRRLLLALVAAAALAAIVGTPRVLHHLPPTPAPAPPARSDVGFRSQERLAEHWRKHGREFGDITEGQYLVLAQWLRDRPPGGGVLEAVRADGVITRFDRASGAFLAFDRDGTIRTFFKPHDGEAYFRRQLAHQHGEP